MSSRLLVLLLSLIVSLPVLANDKFGRFFTTPKQRTQLDELRNKKVEDVTISEEEFFAEEDIEDEAVKLDGVTIKGLVYRKDSKSTAWINDNNTYEGSPESEYIRIKENNISSDELQVEMSSSDTKVNLKVGQTFDLNTKTVSDLTETAVNTELQAAEDTAQ